MIDEEEHTVIAWLNRERTLLRSIWQAMRVRLCDTGLEDALNTIPGPDSANYKLKIDPFDSSRFLMGIWSDKHGSQIGEIQVRDNGSVYAEIDVVRNHPNDGRWFVESVTAWGNRNDIKTELRLLPTI